jgi:uncharacterized protein involved in exopolysaccharide biosynthesis
MAPTRRLRCFLGSTQSLVKITLACSLAGVFAAAAISFTIPPRYISQTIVAAAPATEADRRLDVLTQDAFSYESLARIIEEKKLYPDERRWLPLNHLIDRMQRDIHVIPNPLVSAGKSNTTGKRDTTSFVVQFDYSDPEVAQQVSDELVSQLLRANLRAALQSQSHLPRLLVEHEPSLTQEPSRLLRIQLTITGLFAGLLGGLGVAAILGSRHDTNVINR